MADDKNLLDRIAKISGQINVHRTHIPSFEPPKGPRHLSVQFPTNPSSGPENMNAPRGPRNFKAPPATAARASQITHRVAPYNRRRPAVRNRTLVLNNKTNKPSSIPNDDSSNQEPGFITKHDRHMQLINTSIYDQKKNQRNKAIEESRQQKLIERNQQEKQKVQQHVSANIPRAANGMYSLTINGIQFSVINDGTKLERIRGPLDSSRPTPKQADVGGVKFFRTTNGNLLRNGVAKAKRNFGNRKQPSEPCSRFTSTGQCPRGPRCPFIHDPDKIAMCKDYLRNGTCHPTGDVCHLSHDPTPERVPACLHFLRGNCTNVSCRYAHVRVNPSAPVCRAFATIGYCSKGADCSERHVHECPDYTNTGVCRNKKCHLPHIDKADQMKKHAANNLGSRTHSPEDNDSDLISEEDDESANSDIDSDGLEELMNRTDVSHALSQQQDFVHF